MLEVTDPPRVDWAAARLWRVLVTLEGAPVAGLWVPSPGRLERPEAFTRSLLPGGRRAAARAAAYERYRERLGLPRRRRPPHPRVSVVVCTHRRSAYLPGLLQAVRRLDPAPHEVIVVDNAPGELDSRAAVEAAGARYVREDRKGLDHARMAGLRAAGGELVAFTDDDCLPEPRWLAGLAELFDDPSVAAVTGPAFAYELATPAQLRFELEGGFSRGFERRVWDWTTISPLHAGVVGAGANMVFRRRVLESHGDPFPPELDAGTPTESGGDMFALYRTLEAGHRVVYDPGTYVLHRHRPDPAALHHAVWGYGVGLSAVMAKVLVERGELGAPHAWGWLWRQYRSALLRRLAGTADARRVRVAWDYLRGGLAGPAAWARARRAIDPVPAARPSPPAAAPLLRPAATPAAPAVSVVVPTASRPAALARCLSALAAQAGAPPFEVIVVDDRPGAGIDAGEARVVHGRSDGAAAARNAGAAAARGDLLLFLDDDLVSKPELIARHAERQAAEGAETVVIGYSPPAPAHPGLCEKAQVLWWHEHFSLLADAAELTFADMLTGNVSMPRVLFERLGGFDEAMGRMRREDWAFGHAALRAGARLVYEPAAVAPHVFSLTTVQRLRAAREEGSGDALLARHHTDLAAALEPPYAAAGLLPRAGLALLAAAVPPALGPAAAVLDALERLRLRGCWRTGYRAAQWAMYASGRGGLAGTDPLPARWSVAAHSDDPLPAPGPCAAPFDLVLPGGGRARIAPSLGRWNRLVAQAAAAAEADAAQPDDGSEPGPAPLVLLGPAHSAADAAGTGAVRVQGDPARHWAAVGEAIARGSAEWVLVPMPGAALTPAALRRVAGALDGDEVAVVLGHDLDGADPVPQPRSRRLSPERHPSRLPGLRYVGIRRERLQELGGFDPALDALGPYAPPLDLAERALDAGLVVRQEPVGVPAATAQRVPRAQLRARGALLARDGARRSRLAAAAATARGALPLAGDVVRGRAGLAAILAHLAGAAAGARRPARIGRTPDSGAT